MAEKDKDSQLQQSSKEKKGNFINNNSEELEGKQFYLMGKRFTGPIPPPEILHQYREVLPDAPERILSMAEKQQNHRMDLEKE